MAEKKVIFIVADEARNAGERDYMKAIAATLQRHPPSDVRYITFKTGTAAPPDTHGGALQDVSDLPVTNTQYEAVARFDPARLPAAAAGELHVIGMGHSTLQDVAVALDTLQARGIPARGHYITHMLSSAQDAQIIETQNITVFAPLRPGDIAPGIRKNLVPLESVPHTNTQAACLIEEAAFKKTPNGIKLRQYMAQGEPFAFAVLNAGFPVEGTHIPYTPAEAARDGRALGAHLPAGTHLLLAHGGPRNTHDTEANGGADNMALFTAAYLAAQKEKGATPDVLQERFNTAAGYNVIKAGYLLARSPLCRAFICNAEGYGTMDGAVLHVDNRKTLLGMFPFGALETDPTGQRQANTVKYNQRGICLLSVKNGKIALSRHPQEEKTPRTQRDAADVVLRHTGLVATGPVARQRPRPPGP